jgi:hypothetical protein
MQTKPYYCERRASDQNSSFQNCARQEHRCFEVITEGWSQDTASPQPPKPATEPKLILEVKESSFAVWLPYDQYSPPRLVLRVFSDRSAEVHLYQQDMKRTTLTPEQFEKIRFFLNHPDLLSRWGVPYCGSGGSRSGRLRTLSCATVSDNSSSTSRISSLGRVTRPGRERVQRLS